MLNLSEAISWLVLLSQIYVGLLVLALIPGIKKLPLISHAHAIIAKKPLLIAFLVALAGMLGSLFYSEVIGYEPCRLCWFQRIFLYPLVFIYGIALWKKDKHIWQYALPLIIVGGLIAGYQYTLQVLAGFTNIADTCSATAVSCTSAEFWAFHYITIPLMSFSAFVLLLVAMLELRRHAKNSIS